MACAYPEDTDYDWELLKCIQTSFITRVSPLAVLPFIHQYGENVLTRADVQKIRAHTDQHGAIQGACVLLERLCNYDDWFSCLMQVLRDPEVKLSHIADEMEAKKRTLDSRLEKDRQIPGEEMQDQGVMELEAGCDEPEESEMDTSQLNAASSTERKVTEKVYTELRNVDRAFEQLKSEHKVKVKQFEQEIEKLRHSTGQYELRIKQLEQEKERELRCFQDQVRELKKEKENLEQLIRQERKQQKDQISLHKEKINELEDETRQKDQLIAKQSTQITNMRNAIGNLEMERKRWVTSKKEISDLLSATQENDGVILFNYYVMCRMRKKHPDLAKKYKIQEWSAPSHLQDTSKWIAWQSSSYIEPSVREVREGGLTAAKKIIQTRLRNILNDVNMRKEMAMNENMEKYWLQDDIIVFFRYCFSCLLGLGHNDTAFQQCLEDVHGIIHKDIDMLTSDWADVLSEDTYDKGLIQSLGLGRIG